MRPAAIRALLDMPEAPLPRLCSPPWDAVELPPRVPLAALTADAPPAIGAVVDGRGATMGESAGNPGTGGKGSISAISGICGGCGTGTETGSEAEISAGDTTFSPTAKSSWVNWTSETRSAFRGGGSGIGTSIPTTPNPETLSQAASVPMFSGWRISIMRWK